MALKLLATILVMLLPITNGQITQSPRVSVVRKVPRLEKVSVSPEGAIPGRKSVVREVLKGSMIEKNDDSVWQAREVRTMQMISQNPNATKEACEKCIDAEDALVASLTALSTAQTDLSTAQTALQEATSAHAKCVTEFTTMVTTTAATKENVLASLTSITEHVHNDNAESALLSVSRNGTHPLSELLTAWRDSKTAQTTKASECERLVANKNALRTVMETKQQAVSNAVDVHETAETSAASACAAMRKSGYGAPTPSPTSAPTPAPTPSPISWVDLRSNQMPTSEDFTHFPRTHDLSGYSQGDGHPCRKNLDLSTAKTYCEGVPECLGFSRGQGWTCYQRIISGHTWWFEKRPRRTVSGWTFHYVSSRQIQG